MIEFKLTCIFDILIKDTFIFVSYKKTYYIKP